ncbi:MAG: ATP synthase F1 subunit gamma [Clostridiales bacterium]|nr:ATP synthase F1 subunit gamma [Clostridiales bacterium]
MRELRLRLGSIQNTKQITESMRLISTQKVQRVRLRMMENKPYLEHAASVVRDLLAEADYAGHRYFAGGGEGGPLVILITGDRGLCGGYNTNASKEGYALARKTEGSQAICVGAKGRDYFRRRQQEMTRAFRGLSENPFHEDARSIADIALSMYNEGRVGEVYLVYTEYHTMLLQEPKVWRVLPVSPDGAGAGDAGMRWLSKGEALIQYAVSAYVASAIYGAMLESAVCEQCSRVMSMDSAVKNADKMIATLTLRFNETRQGAITQEIAEVVGGANVIAE